MRIYANRTAYSGHLPSDQPPSGVPTVCDMPPRTRSFAVTRDSRNRARRKRKVRSPYPLEEMDHHKLYIKCGDTRTASRDPTTHTRGPTPPNLGATNNWRERVAMAITRGAAAVVARVAPLDGEAASVVGTADTSHEHNPDAR